MIDNKTLLIDLTKQYLELVKSNDITRANIILNLINMLTKEETVATDVQQPASIDKNVPKKSSKRKKFDVSEIIKLYNEGATIVQIAEQYKISVSSLHKILRENGFRKFSRLTQEQIETILEMGRSGTPAIDIANKIGCSIYTILRHLKKTHLKKPKHLVLNERYNKAKYYINNGMTVGKACNAAGISKCAYLHREKSDTNPAIINSAKNLENKEAEEKELSLASKIAEEMKKSGEPFCKVCEKYNITPNETLQEYVVMHNREIDFKIIKKYISEIIFFIEDGESIKETARAYDITPSSLAIYLKQQMHHIH
jgi:DNA invertase Pin-like site-specific DNA recombinase/DNA-binding XRE family transcriptional regulator